MISQAKACAYKQFLTFGTVPVGRGFVAIQKVLNINLYIKIISINKKSNVLEGCGRDEIKSNNNITSSGFDLQLF